MAFVSSWYSASIAGNPLTNHVGPQVLVEMGAKKGVKMSQFMKIVKNLRKFDGLDPFLYIEVVQGQFLQWTFDHTPLKNLQGEKRCQSGVF
jgi:hypothetical protein